jgi:carboxyl-terminal processing protease
LQKQGPVKGLILDLRNNPGGILEASIGVSAAFLQPDQVVVSTDGRVPDVKAEMTADPKYYLNTPNDTDPIAKLDPVFKRVPIVVLVNSGSASASEIVAGALQDHRRALIIGAKTFGKGSVQRLYPLINNTAVKLTVALYFTPNKRSIQAEGILPDIIVEDPSAKTDFAIREADLQRHIDKPSNGDDKSSDASQKATDTDSNITCRPVDKKDQKRDPVRFGDPDDYQLQQAIKYLRTPGQFDKSGRPVIRSTTRKPVKEVIDKKA